LFHNVKLIVSLSIYPNNGCHLLSCILVNKMEDSIAMIFLALHTLQQKKSITLWNKHPTSTFNSKFTSYVGPPIFFVDWNEAQLCGIWNRIIHHYGQPNASKQN
jgi:hypothetical protein